MKRRNGRPYGWFGRSLEPMKKDWGGFFKIVPRTDTGALDEKSQACQEHPKVRELGKLAPYLRYKGCLGL